MSDYGSRAHVEFDPMGMGPRLALRRLSPDGAVIFRWPDTVMEFVRSGEYVADNDTTKPPVWLRLTEDDARAIYEALADYFGHSGNDVRQLRRDYDAERTRVDRLITNLIAPAVSS